MFCLSNRIPSNPVLNMHTAILTSSDFSKFHIRSLKKSPQTHTKQCIQYKVTRRSRQHDSFKKTIQCLSLSSGIHS